jgi:hypothetical protein
MKPPSASRLDRALANVFAQCPTCRTARRRQQGVVFELVKRVETEVCLFCRAYARVHRHPAHQRVPLKQFD